MIVTTAAGAAGTVNGIMARLREQTWPQHQRAESRPLEQALAQGTLSRAGFVQYLAQRFPVYQALERALGALRSARPELGAVLDEGLFQEQNLDADLRFFGVAAAHVVALGATRALIEEIERIAAQDAVGLLGVNYVFEGSKNGARFIAKRMAAVQQLSREGGLRYLDPHGEHQRPLWQDFKARMDACAFGAEEQDKIVAAAQRTFDGIAAMDDELYAAISQDRASADAADGRR